MQDHSSRSLRAGCRAGLVGLCALLVVLVAGLSPDTTFAQFEEGDSPPPERATGGERSDGPLLRIQRIELGFSGGRTWGDTYLDLPPLDNDQTNDTALDQILDFSGGPTNIEAARKKLEPGVLVGASATFFVSPNFGMQLFGRFARADAVLTGLPIVEGVTLEDREEIDRSTVTTIALGGNVVYHIGRERKRPVRPFVNLGFGGVLNRFDDTDDVNEGFFNYGMGIGFPVVRNFRGFVAVNSMLFTWDTDEVSRDSTMQLPMITLGLVWRYYVPEDDPVVEEEEEG